MTALHPHLLWLILPALAAGAALYAASRRIRRKRLAQFTTIEETAAILRSPDEKRRLIRHSLMVLALCFFIAALARPMTGPKEATADRQGLDVMIALDVSKSMLCTDTKPYRMEAAREAIRKWLNGRESDRVGLILFAGESFLQLPLTSDLSVFRTLLDAASPKVIGMGGTNLEKPLQTAMEVYGRVKGSGHALILFSDGENLEGDPVKLAAEALTKCGLHTYTVGLGTSEGAKVPTALGTGKHSVEIRNSYGVAVRSRLDATKLRAIAAAGGGEYVSLAENRNALEDLQWTQLSRLARQSREIKASDFDEWFELPLLLALACLSAELWLSRRAAPLKSAPATAKAAVLLMALLVTSVSAVRAEPSPTPGPDLKQAQRLIAAGKAPEAAEAMRQAAAKNPKDQQTLYNLGVAEYAAGHFKESADAFENVLNLPESELTAKAMFQLGNAHVRLGESMARTNKTAEAATEMERAIALYREALQKNRDAGKNLGAAEPAYCATLEQLADAQIAGANKTADPAGQRGQLQKALAALEKIIQLQQDNGRVKGKADAVRDRLVANLMAEAQKKRDEAHRVIDSNGEYKSAYSAMRNATESATQAADTDPKNQQARQFLDETRRDFSNIITTKAQSEFDTALKTTKPGTRYATIKSVNERLEEALAIDPQNTAASDLMKQVRAELEKTAMDEGDAAMRAAERAKDPTGAAVSLTKAVDNYKQALDINPQNERAKSQIDQIEPKLAAALTQMGKQELNAAKQSSDAANAKRAEVQSAMNHIAKADEALTQAASHGADPNEIKKLSNESGELSAKLQGKLEQMNGAASNAANGTPKDAPSSKEGADSAESKDDGKEGGKPGQKMKGFADIRKTGSGKPLQKAAQDW